MSLLRHSLFPLLAVLLLTAAHTAPAADETSGRKKELQRIRREMEEKRREIRKAGRKERSILSEIERIDRAIQTGEAELARQEKQLREAEAAFKDAEAGSAGVLRDLEGLNGVYRARVRALYKMGRSGYAVALFPSEGWGPAVRRVKYLSVIADRDREVITAYGSALSRLTGRQAEIAKRKDDILRRREVVASRKKDLELQRQRKSEFLAGVRSEKELYEQTLGELEESSAALWAAIKKAEQEKKAALRAAKLARLSPQPGLRQGSGSLPWPAEGSVITPYGAQRHPQFGTMVFRRGIEIEAQPGTAVRAVQDGAVAYADWQKGYGKLMIIEHGDGFYTLYGHLSRLDAAKDARVQKGQVIGLVGDTGSSKGAKLYFEIRANGEAQDPLRWLARR